MLAAPKTTLNNWILTKITQFLATREGCNVERQAFTEHGMKAIVQDAFGYRYKIHIETLSRVDNHPEDLSNVAHPQNNYSISAKVKP